MDFYLINTRTQQYAEKAMLISQVLFKRKHCLKFLGSFKRYCIDWLPRSFLNKVADLRPATLLKKETLAQVFFCEFCKIYPQDYQSHYCVIKKWFQLTCTCSKSTMETPKQCKKSVHRYRKRHQNDVIGAVLVSLLLTLKRFPTLLSCIHFWLWASKYRGIKERPGKVIITFLRHRNLKKTEFKISCFEILCKNLCANALKYIVSKKFTQPPITRSNLAIETLGQGVFIVKFENIHTLF